MRSREKFLALLLSLTITLTFMPSVAFAMESDDVDTTTVEEEKTVDDADAADQVSDPVDAPEAEDEDADLQQEGTEETITIDNPDDKTVGKKSITLAGEEDLLEGFLAKEASQSAKSNGTALPARNTRGSKLTGNDKVVYDELKRAVEKIARGEKTSTVIEVPMSLFTGGKLVFTAEDLGVAAIVENGRITAEANEAFLSKFDFDYSKVVQALLADLPYDFYWFDKTTKSTASTSGEGISAEYYEYGGGVDTIFFVNENEAWTIPFYVSENYSATGKEGTTDINTDRTSAAATAAENAGKIVSNNSDKSDLQKLQTYKDDICNMVSYDDDGRDPATAYGDIWQMINVFDGDDTTNVVCEGYSKAFQFLCDISEFRSREVMSHIVTGTMENEDHMWNVVHMENDKNYIVDVTNCDQGTIGYPDKLFLNGCYYGSVDDGYVFACGGGRASYKYDAETRAIYDDEELEMATIAYMEPLPVGSSGSCGENLTYAVTGTETNKMLTISGTGKMKNYDHETAPWIGDITIKSVVIENGVTSIGNYAFKGCTGLTDATIPASITSIGYSAFKYCSGLTSIEIPTGVTSIGGEAFGGCTGLKRATFKHSSTDGETSMGHEVFDGCTSLTNVALPGNLKSIDNGTFSKCSSLASIDIPESVTSMGSFVFSRCASLISVKLPKNVESIGQGAFFSCTSLTSVEFPEALTYIGEEAFHGCSSLTGIEFPDKLESIDKSAFAGCDSLTNIVIPGSMKSIGNSAFAYCDGLTGIVIPGSVTNIGSYAFAYCSGLTSIVIPGSVTSIGERAVYECYDLDYIFFSGSKDQWEQLNCTEYGKAIVHYNANGGHTWADVYSEDKAATCMEDGSESIHCSQCSAVQDGSTIVIPKDPNAHTFKWTTTKAVTCTEDGTREYACVHCGAQQKTERIPATGHSYGGWIRKNDSQHQRVCANDNSHVEIANHSWDTGIVTKAATQTATGTKLQTCTACKATKTVPIEMLPRMTISKTMFTWNNKVQTPAVYVRVGSRALRNGTDYTVTYPKGRRNIGTYTIRVTLKNGYSGVRTASYTIVPKGSKLTGASAARRTVTVKWAKQTGKMPKARINGYQIQYSLRKDFKSGNKAVNVGGYNKNSRKISGLASKKTYYFRIRTYMRSGGKTCYSSWSNVRAAKAR